MKDIETILLEKYKLQRVAIELNGPQCIVAQNEKLQGVVAAPGHFDMSGKWIVRFIPIVLWDEPGQIYYCQLGAMIEKRFDSKDECVEYLNTQSSQIYEKLYTYTLKVIKSKVKSLEELEGMDPTNNGQFMEVLK